MNVQLTQAVKDITGVTGPGDHPGDCGGRARPPAVGGLTPARGRWNCGAGAQALTGHYRRSICLTLKQAWPSPASTVSRLPSAIGDRASLPISVQPAVDDLHRHWTPSDGKNQGKNGPKYDARNLLYQLGRRRSGRHPRPECDDRADHLAGIGTDLSAFPTDKHFCSGSGWRPTTTSPAAGAAQSDPQDAEPGGAGVSFGRPVGQPQSQQCFRCVLSPYAQPSGAKNGRLSPRPTRSPAVSIIC